MSIMTMGLEGWEGVEQDRRKKWDRVRGGEKFCLIIRMTGTSIQLGKYDASEVPLLRLRTWGTRTRRRTKMGQDTLPDLGLA